MGGRGEKHHKKFGEKVKNISHRRGNPSGCHLQGVKTPCYEYPLQQGASAP
jgi:hypothetical protein